MLKLAANLVTIGSLSVPVLIYQEQSRVADEYDDWREHTHVAQSRAEAVARLALRGEAPPVVAAAVDRFATTTSDNPAQVENARRLREALGSGDLGRVAALAEDAIAEEARLLPGRADAARRQKRSQQDKATILWGCGVAAAVIQAVVGWQKRSGDA